MLWGLTNLTNFLNSSAPSDEQTSSFLAIFLKSGVNVANYMKKCCSCGQAKQIFFKYFSTQASDFEKMSITDDVCLLNLGADELRDLFQTVLLQY